MTVWICGGIDVTQLPHDGSITETTLQAGNQGLLASEFRTPYKFQKVKLHSKRETYCSEYCSFQVFTMLIFQLLYAPA